MSNKSLRLVRKTACFAILLTSPFSAQVIHAQSADQTVVSAPTLNVLYRFQYNGKVPSGYSRGSVLFDELVQGADGNFYGTTAYGGTGTCSVGVGVIGCGTVFKITPAGTQTVLYNFTYDSTTNTAVNGIYPFGGLVQGKDGSFYGTASAGGNSSALCNGTLGCGTIFKITTKGQFTLLHQFNGVFATPPEGGGPGGRMILATDGRFYGTTFSGGSGNEGTIFAISSSGAFTTVYGFNNQQAIPDGENPYAGLIQGKDNSFYGTTQFGGASNAGTIFRFSTSGMRVLHSFVQQAGQIFPDGAQPMAALVQASDGNFYGTASTGGALSTYFQSGTLFKITPKGVFTKLWDFNANSSPLNGLDPIGGLIQASDGNLYGTTSAAGGPANSGTLYELTLGGVLSQVTTFDSTTTGDLPKSVLLQAADGTLYITNSQGGGTHQSHPDEGTIVHLASGLPAPTPAIRKFSPVSGLAGQTVTITGSSFVGTTAVAFAGSSATFKVKSTNTLTTTVPAGAASGTITVTNAGGSVASVQTFTVLP